MAAHRAAADWQDYLQEVAVEQDLLRLPGSAMAIAGAAAGLDQFGAGVAASRKLGAASSPLQGVFGLVGAVVGGLIGGLAAPEALSSRPDPEREAHKVPSRPAPPVAAQAGSPALRSPWSSLARQESALDAMDPYNSVSLALLVETERAVRTALLEGSSPEVTAEVVRAIGHDSILARVMREGRPATMLPLIQWCAGLERGLGTGSGVVLNYLSTITADPTVLLIGPGLSETLEAVRNPRNALAHGRADRWGRSDHAGVVSAVLGKPLLAQWLRHPAATTAVAGLLTRPRGLLRGALCDAGSAQPAKRADSQGQRPLKQRQNRRR